MVQELGNKGIYDGSDGINSLSVASQQFQVQELGNKGIYDGSDGINSLSVSSQQFQNQLLEPIHEYVNTVIRETYHDSEDEVKMAHLLLSLPPLGLTLRQIPFLLDFIQTRLFPGGKSKFTAEINQNKTQSMCEREKMKAVNFSALLLRIGSWQRGSRNEGDLVAKFYYAKRKLVWEILEKSLKSKIEVQWSDVMGLRAILEENQPGILEIELSQPPTFYKETNPQPRKHTLWNASLDFTDGQALLNRRHYLEFPPGVLDKHYEKLLQRESRFFAMSRRSFPVEESPYFIFSFGFNGNGHEMNYAMHTLPYRCPPMHFDPAHHPHQMREPANEPPISIYPSTSTISDDFISSSHVEMHTLANDQNHELLPLDTRNQDAIMCSEGAVSQHWLPDGCWIPDGQVPSNIESNLLSSQVDHEYTESSQLHLRPVSWQLPSYQNIIPLYPSFPLNPLREDFMAAYQISDGGRWNPSGMTVKFTNM